MFEFKYNVTKQDYLEFNLFHINNAAYPRKTIMFRRYGYPVSFLVLALLLAYITKHPIISFSVNGAFAILWIAFYKKLTILMTKKHIEKLGRTSKLPYNNDVLLKFDDDFIHEKTEEGELKIKYSALTQIEISDSAIYLYHNALQAFIIPLRVFANEQEKNTFIEFIKTIP